MTEPDGAILWARERMATRCDEDGFPDLAEGYRRGDRDEALRKDFEAYRAGAVSPWYLAKSEAGDLLAWLEQHPELELSWGDIGDVSEGNWRVHARHGGVNDREWRLVDVGRTPTEALTNARVQLKEADQ